MLSTNKYVIVGDSVEEVKLLLVHSFSIGDVEDPELYAAVPLYEWEKSEKGQWVINNAIEPPTYHQCIWNFGYKYKITAKFIGPRLTEYLLKYGSGI